MENHEKRYKDLLNAIKVLRENNPSDEGIQNWVNDNVPELKESEDEKIRKELYDFCIKCSHGDTLVNQQEDFLRWATWLEKQREKNPADKVEPKFKVGDWITDGNITIQIEAIKNDCYLYCGDCALYSIKTADKVYHLWTIQDAKDGDVLCDGTTIFIFKDLLSDGSVMSYCDYDTGSSESDAFCSLSMNLMCSKITPATKEQRDLLFQKMKEAGYEWDADKKELKEIEQKHTWSEEDEEKFRDVIRLIEQGAPVQSMRDHYTNWLKSLKERMK